MEERRRLIFGGILFLVAAFAFGSGYLANGEAARTPVVIEACSDIASSSLLRTSSP